MKNILLILTLWAASLSAQDFTMTWAKDPFYYKNTLLGDVVIKDGKLYMLTNSANDRMNHTLNSYEANTIRSLATTKLALPSVKDSYGWSTYFYNDSIRATSLNAVTNPKSMADLRQARKSATQNEKPSTWEAKLLMNGSLVGQPKVTDSPSSSAALLKFAFGSFLMPLYMPLSVNTYLQSKNFKYGIFARDSSGSNRTTFINIVFFGTKQPRRMSIKVGDASNTNTLVSKHLSNTGVYYALYAVMPFHSGSGDKCTTFKLVVIDGEGNTSEEYPINMNSNFCQASQDLSIQFAIMEMDQHICTIVAVSDKNKDIEQTILGVVKVDRTNNTVSGPKYIDLAGRSNLDSKKSMFAAGKKGIRVNFIKNICVKDDGSYVVIMEQKSVNQTSGSAVPSAGGMMFTDGKPHYELHNLSVITFSGSDDIKDIHEVERDVESITCYDGGSCSFLHNGKLCVIYNNRFPKDNTYGLTYPTEPVIMLSVFHDGKISHYPLNKNNKQELSVRSDQTYVFDGGYVFISATGDDIDINNYTSLYYGVLQIK